jgi:hypothetical protein
MPYRAITRAIRRPLLAAACLMLLASHEAHAAEPAVEKLVPTLKQLAGEAITDCQTNGYKNVGVLSFLVVKESTEGEISPDTLTKNIGSIHDLLARRLEVAMLLANPTVAPIGIIDCASEVAADRRSGSVLSRGARRQLLEESYPLHWGDHNVKPEAFFTGVMRVDPSLKFASLSLLRFSADELDLAPVGGDRVVAVEAAMLAEIGESYSLTRGAFTGGSIKAGDDFPDDLPDDLPADEADESSVDAAIDARNDDDSHPLNTDDAAVRVQILYDDQPAPQKVVDGQAIVPEPQPGQKVQIRVVKDQTPRRYAICVKVNGECAFGRERLPDKSCRKYLLSKPGQVMHVDGYQMDNNRVERFRVLATAESKGRAFDYGQDVGAISVTVFPEVAKDSTPDTTEGDKAEALIAAGKLPDRRPNSFGKLKLQLLGYANRGLIVQGESAKSHVRVVPFSEASAPAMHLSIQYYKP